MNNQLRVKNLDLLEEDREIAHIRLVAYKEKIKKYFDKQVQLRDFLEGDFFLRRVDIPRKEAVKRKMVAN